ncbi:chorismate mutase [Paenibacillus sp. URB8-2]|uniref:chorismate mutase n=1 Tax=Paenibacillus sp. URB8-2 TaxID=2741301 RepID=UPI0015BCA506|nr:chorismate mutase [Paenibacillus sp. URB8-2]BCG56872.1 hypothetical protein PUR_02970 [Paenibacillus sp. URB8-2]
MTKVQLNAHRNEIDRIDREIIALISARTRVVKKLMVLKTDEESIRSCDRVQQVLDKVSKLAEENGLEPEIAVSTYQTLIKVLTDMQLEYFRSDKLSKTTEV